MISYEDIEIAYNNLAEATKTLIDAQTALNDAQVMLSAAEANYIALGKARGSNAEQRKADLKVQLMHHYSRIYTAEKALAKAQLDYDLVKLPISKYKMQLQLQGQINEAQRLEDSRYYAETFLTIPASDPFNMEAALSDIKAITEEGN